MTVKTYTRNPEKFEAMLYDGTNVEEVLEWCTRGIERDGELIIKNNAEEIIVVSGQYILKINRDEICPFVPKESEYFESEYSEIVGSTVSRGE